MTQVKEFLDTHPQVRTFLRVFTYAFLSVFGLTLFDFLNDVREWAEGTDLPFPDVSTLAKAAAGAFAGAVSGVLAVIWNAFGFTKSAVYAPVEHPLDHNDRGQSGTNLILMVAGILAIVALLIWIVGAR